MHKGSGTESSLSKFCSPGTEENLKHELDITSQPRAEALELAKPRGMEPVSAC